MKIDRLIGILSVLLQKDTVTAPDLAARFEVSRRTINRDIEDLCKAGIPIVTRQGAGGGISIMDNYKIGKTLITNTEMQDFDQSVLIDLSSWYKDSLASKIQMIRSAIDKRREISFRYYSPGGESWRVIEPYYLIFRWSSWYVWGWCGRREDYRLFKLNRLEQLKITEKVFDRRQAAVPDFADERIFPGGIRVKAVFEPECKWRLVEEFGTGCYEELPDGKLLFQADYTNKENLITWLMSFRDRVILMEPEEIRRELCAALQNVLQKYNKGEENR